MKYNNILSIVLIIVISALLFPLQTSASPPAADLSPDTHKPMFSGSASNHTLLLSYGGTISAWGDNQYGQCGTSNSEQTLSEINYIDLPNIVQVSAGGGHSLALDKDGVVYSWGDNRYGQLGYVLPYDKLVGHVAYPSDNSEVPRAIITLPKIVQIAAGETHCLALDENGNVWAWGSDRAFTWAYSVPTRPEDYIPLTMQCQNIKQIATKYNHSLALDNDGKLWAWGDNSHGQLGSNNPASVNLPQRLEVIFPQAIEIKAIDTGRDHSIALAKVNGADVVFGWGSNAQYQLGQPDTSLIYPPVEILSGVVINDVIAGEYRNVAVGIPNRYWGTGCYYDKELVKVGDYQLEDYSADVLEVPTSRYINGDIIACGNIHDIRNSASGHIALSGKNDNAGLLKLASTDAMSPNTIPFLSITPSRIMSESEVLDTTFDCSLNFVKLNSDVLDKNHFALHPYVPGSGIEDIQYISDRELKIKVNPYASNMPILPMSPTVPNSRFDYFELNISWRALTLNRAISSSEWLQIDKYRLDIQADSPILSGQENGKMLTATISNGSFNTGNVHEASNWHVSGTQAGVSIESIDVIDDNTIKLTLTGNSVDKYSKNEISISCDSTEYTDSNNYDIYRNIVGTLPLVSFNSVTFTAQSRPSSGYVPTNPKPSAKPHIENRMPYVLLRGTEIDIAEYISVVNDSGKVVASNLTVDGASGDLEISQGAKTFIADKSGNAELTVKDSVSGILISFPICVYAPADDIATSFDDTRGHWAEQGILNAVKDGFILGDNDKSFRPDDSVSIEEFLAILVRLQLTDAPAPIMRNDFAFDSSNWAKCFVLQALNGLTDEQIEFGFGTNINTAKPITREQVAFLLTVLEQDNGEIAQIQFTDIGNSKFKRNIEFSSVKGWLIGYPDGTFNPAENITRAESVVLANRIFK